MSDGAGPFVPSLRAGLTGGGGGKVFAFKPTHVILKLAFRLVRAGQALRKQTSMTTATESQLQPPQTGTPAGTEPGPDRRADIDGKQTLIGALLKEVGCDGLLVLDP